MAMMPVMKYADTTESSTSDLNHFTDIGSYTNTRHTPVVLMIGLRVVREGDTDTDTDFIDIRP